MKEKQTNFWKYATFILGALFVVALFSFGFKINGKVVDEGTTRTAPVQQKTARVSVSADDDPRDGPKDAPVEIIEFSDFQCPFCARAEPTIKRIKAEYGDKVSVVYRDFPLSRIHPMAQKAAEAGECVQEAGGDEAFWKFHDVVFANQQALSVDNLKLWAKDLGYDIGDCLDSGKMKSEVEKDAIDAQNAGARGTPYFVINGQPVSGAQPFEVFKQIIDSQLN